MVVLLFDFILVFYDNFQFFKLIIVVVNGFVFVGGWLIVQVCDFCVVSIVVKFVIIEVKVGCGSFWVVLLIYMILQWIFMEIVFIGKLISVVWVYEIGLVNCLVEFEVLMDVVIMLVYEVFEGVLFLVKVVCEMVMLVIEMGCVVVFDVVCVVYEVVYISVDVQEGLCVFVQKCKFVWCGC